MHKQMNQTLRNFILAVVACSPNIYSEEASMANALVSNLTALTLTHLKM